MVRTLGIYTIPDVVDVCRTILEDIKDLDGHCDRLIISTTRNRDGIETLQGAFPNATLVSEVAPPSWHFQLVLAAVEALPTDGFKEFDRLILTGGQLIGPFGGLGPYLEDNGIGETDIFAPLAYRPQNEHRKEDHEELLAKLPDQVPSSEFMIFNAGALSAPGFRDMLVAEDDPALDNPIVPQTDLRIAAFAEKHGLTVRTPVDHGVFETTIPWFFESDALLKAGLPFLSTRLVHTPYPIQDLMALNLKRTLETIRRTWPEDYRRSWSYILTTGKLRNIHAIADEVEIIDEIARNPDKTEWSFGPIAVFIHAYYAEMMEEFWELIERIDVPKRVFITTATTQNRQKIEVFLGDKGVDADAFDVRVVEQNRGRDMSSLFISFRDVILSGEYDVCLRLHSKRTPQVQRQVGQSFKDHLFDNLVYTSGYVRNVLDFFEDNPDVGLMMPPTIHIGFGTLGHSWFNNYDGVKDWAKTLELDVKLDDHTPLAPYGTMYWFRADALRKIFAFGWKWEDYNEEPMHVDGGVAHLQERLIGYVAQDAGYRVLSIANRRDAARNYAKLEFKLQMLAAEIPHANIYYQQQYMWGGTDRIRTIVLGFLTRIYRDQVMTRPGLLKVVRPVARKTRALLGRKV